MIHLLGVGVVLMALGVTTLVITRDVKSRIERLEHYHPTIQRERDQS